MKICCNSFLLPVIIACILISCGQEKQEEQQTTAPVPTPATEEEAIAGPQDEQQEVEVTVKAIGNTMSEMAYEPVMLKIPANSKVTLTLINEAKAEGMNHNIVIIAFGTGEEVAREGLEAGPDKEYIPENKNVIAGSKVALPGESVTLKFTAPKAGSYHFICTYPGHFPQMIGRLNVESIN